MKAVPLALCGLAAACAAPSPAGASARSTPVAAATAAPAAASSEVDDLIQRGRARLEDGQLAEALALFGEAEKLDHGSLRTRTWTLRTWIAQGRVNDALNEIDALSRGAKGPAIDYLYGMAFAQKGKGYVAEGVTGGVVGMSFTDAIEYLKRATQADAALYRDAFLALAESAWYGGDLESAHAAASKAVELRPRDPEAHLVQGKVEFSRFVALREEEGRKSDAEASWAAARAAFTQAAELLAPATDPAQRSQRAEALSQVAWLAVWKGDLDAAAKAFGTALGIDPAVADYAALRERLSREQFVAVLEDAAKAYATAHGPDAAGDATLLWWLGLGRFELKRNEEAEAAFARAVAKWPAFTNSWYYIALSRYFRQDYDGAIAALRQHYAASVEDCVASIRSNEAENLRIVDYLIALKAQKGANVDAAFLSELETAVQPDNDRYWNNLGLFLRDEGEAREQRSRTLSAEARLAVNDLYERAYVAYQKCLELSPDDPNYLNDAALMLHYHLDRDLDQARAWYVKAAERAKAELERKDLSSELRDLRQIALRDATNNLKKLDEELARRK